MIFLSPKNLMIFFITQKSNDFLSPKILMIFLSPKNLMIFLSPKNLMIFYHPKF